MCSLTLDGDEDLQQTGFTGPPLSPLRPQKERRQRLGLLVLHHKLLQGWGGKAADALRTRDTRDTHLANPGAQQADTHLPVIVQVGVEAPAALGQVMEERGHRRVDVGQLDVKQEEAVLVGRARGPSDQRREQVLGETGGAFKAALSRGVAARLKGRGTHHAVLKGLHHDALRQRRGQKSHLLPHRAEELLGLRRLELHLLEGVCV